MVFPTSRHSISRLLDSVAWNALGTVRKQTFQEMRSFYRLKRTLQLFEWLEVYETIQETSIQKWCWENRSVTLLPIFRAPFETEFDSPPFWNWQKTQLTSRRVDIQTKHVKKKRKQKVAVSPSIGEVGLRPLRHLVIKIASGLFSTVKIINYLRTVRYWCSTSTEYL